MPIKLEQLPATLQRGVGRSYLISGDETLLVEEGADAVRGAARQAGCSEREIIEISGQGDWQQLLQSAGAMSLFAERKLLEIRLPTGKPGTEGSKALQEYLSSGGEDVLLIIAGKIDRQSQRAKWFTRLDQEGIVVTVWPVSRRELPSFLTQRLKAAGLTIDRDAVQLLADRVEGNLLAAAQEVDKLKLLAQTNHLNIDHVLDSVMDSSRYSSFGLADTALAGHASSALRTLRGLRAESAQPPVVLWALARDVVLLGQLARDCARGGNLAQAMNQRGVWRSRAALVQGAFNRHNRSSLDQLQHLVYRADATVKGFEPGNPWEVLDQLVTLLSLGSTLPATYLHETA